MIGEGFNYPRMDTLLLAMPISFEGNVEQYAGRLNRNYERKKDVIIFDYIDQHITKLERMYHKRLRAYRKIGFEISAEVEDHLVVHKSIFDSDSYLSVYEKDISPASSRIVISSPSLGSKSVQWFCEQGRRLQERGVKIIVYTSITEDYPEDGREHHRELILILRNSGIHVKEVHCHERYAVIDQVLVWYGSMNLLSNPKPDDTMMRLESPEIASELLEISGTIVFH